MIPVRKIIFIFLGVVLVYSIIDFIIQNIKLTKQQLPITFTLPEGYKEAIDSFYLEKLKVINVYNSKVRNPLAICLYDNVYSVVIYQISSSEKKSLHEFLDVSFKTSDPDYFGAYEGHRDSMPLELLVNVNPNKEALKKLHTNLYGDSLKLVMNTENIVNYCMNLKCFYVKYVEDSDFDMYISSFGKSFVKKRQNIKTSILFNKRKDKIFLFIMMPKKPNIEMPEGLLAGIIRI